MFVQHARLDAIEPQAALRWLESEREPRGWRTSTSTRSGCGQGAGRGERWRGRGLISSRNRCDGVHQAALHRPWRGHKLTPALKVLAGAAGKLSATDFERLACKALCKMRRPAHRHGGRAAQQLLQKARRVSPAGACMPATSKPQLDGRSGATATPRSASRGTQAPSEPSRAQLPPPRASTTARQVTWHSPAGVAKRRTWADDGVKSSACCAGCAACAASWSLAQPSQRWRMCSCTPCPRRRCSQARSKGRPSCRWEDPARGAHKRLHPRPCAQARTSGLPKARINGSICGWRAA